MNDVTMTHNKYEIRHADKHELCEPDIGLFFSF